MAFMELEGPLYLMGVAAACLHGLVSPSASAAKKPMSPSPSK